MGTHRRSNRGRFGQGQSSAPLPSGPCSGGTAWRWLSLITRTRMHLSPIRPTRREFGGCGTGNTLRVEHLCYGTCAQSEPVVMAIRAYLEGQTFDGETIRLMGIAFEMALGSFGATPGSDDPVRAALAHNIIALAKAGERDPERLCEGASKAVPPVELPESGQAAEG